MAVQEKDVPPEACSWDMVGEEGVRKRTAVQQPARVVEAMVRSADLLQLRLAVPWDHPLTWQPGRRLTQCRSGFPCPCEPFPQVVKLANYGEAQLRIFYPAPFRFDALTRKQTNIVATICTAVAAPKDGHTPVRHR